jgi:hypothetical protein
MPGLHPPGCVRDDSITMNRDMADKVEGRVAEAAVTALSERSFVTAVDVFVRIGWLAPVRVDEWRQGRIEYLECGMQVNPAKITTAMTYLRRWARGRGLVASETTYVSRTRDRRPLRFSASGDPEVERNYRTQWVSPALSEAERRRLAERESRPPNLVVISPLKGFTCASCSSDSGDLLVMEDAGPLCLTCARMDHLVFLPSGDAALTRRAKKASTLSAVVVRFSRTRKRYERQGILVEEVALNQAEQECLACRREGSHPTPRTRRAASGPTEPTLRAG